MSDRPIFGAIYLRAMSIASRSNQTVGEKNDLYVTIEQLEAILREVKQEAEVGK